MSAEPDTDPGSGDNGDGGAAGIPRHPDPPRAPREPTVRRVHGDEVVDDYGWMADREDPRLIAYLEAENAYARERTAHLEPLAERIFEEIRSRTVETDLSVPVQHGGWWYYSRTVAGQEYAVHARVAVADAPTRPTLDGADPPPAEQVLLDENAEAAGGEYFDLGACEVSPDGRLLAWSVDRAGDERFDLFVRDLGAGAGAGAGASASAGTDPGADSGEASPAILDEAVRGIGEDVVWSLDGGHVFYTRLDEAFRPHEVWRHRVGSPVDSDVRVLVEDDERFFLSVGSSKDDRVVLLAAGSKTTSQVWAIDAGDPTVEPREIVPRRAGVLADVEPLGDGTLVVHNASRANFEVAWAPADAAGPQDWVPLDWTTPDEFITGVEGFDEFVTVSLRSGGTTAIRVVERDATAPLGFGAAHDIRFPGEAATVGLGSTPDPASPTLQVTHESLASPRAAYDYDVASRTLTLLKQVEVPGYDLASLREGRLWAIAPDGVAVPMSIVFRADVVPDSTAAGLVYGYGAYAVPMDPYFSVARLSLLDRGLVFAVAHVRGGTELGWDWYEQGRLEHKENTVTDFVACADHLVDTGWVAPNRLAAQGASGGGLLLGAAVNRAPGRFAVAFAEVPFVDVLTTMLDPDLPLTVTEHEEWGDPVADPAAYRRIKGYSPYDNVHSGDYPAMLVSTNVHDTRVYVTEPAKWVARLRATVTDDPVCRPILLRTQMSSGHGGRSGRYESWRERAQDFAVVLDLLEATEVRPAAPGPRARG